MNKNSANKTGNGGMGSSQELFKRRAMLMGGGNFASMLFVNPTDLLEQAGRSYGARRINLSGRQRMLIQRAGKYVCFAYQNPDPAPLLAAAAVTLALHPTAEAGLKDGDEELGLDPETNVSVLSALTRANNAVAPSGQTIRDAIERRRVEQEHLQAISDLNGPAHTEMDAAVNLIERVNKGAELSEQMAMLINISGRQRMFTQRLVLLSCLTRISAISGDARQELFIPMNRFSLSLHILNRATPGALQSAESQPIIECLNSVEVYWAALIERISTAPRITEDGFVEQILNFNEIAEELLTRMNEIVLLYEEAAQ